MDVPQHAHWYPSDELPLSRPHAAALGRQGRETKGEKEGRREALAVRLGGFLGR